MLDSSSIMLSTLFHRSPHDLHVHLIATIFFYFIPLWIVWNPVFLSCGHHRIHFLSFVFVQFPCSFYIWELKDIQVELLQSLSQVVFILFSMLDFQILILFFSDGEKWGNFTTIEPNDVKMIFKTCRNFYLYLDLNDAPDFFRLVPRHTGYDHHRIHRYPDCHAAGLRLPVRAYRQQKRYHPCPSYCLFPRRYKNVIIYIKPTMYLIWFRLQQQNKK